MFINFNFIFMFFLIISIISLIINLLHYMYKKEEYRLVKLKKIIIIIFILTLMLFIATLPFFIFVDSNEIVNSLNEYGLISLFFNVSLAIFFSSLIIFFFSFIKSNKSTMDLQVPSRSIIKRGSIEVGTLLNKKKNFSSH